MAPSMKSAVERCNIVPSIIALNDVNARGSEFLVVIQQGIGGPEIGENLSEDAPTPSVLRQVEVEDLVVTNRSQTIGARSKLNDEAMYEASMKLDISQDSDALPGLEATMVANSPNDSRVQHD
ncbi:hypothetical protein V6N13_133312 [Hibiscus sabdariffa]|uniref:Uncharacterized protein n=1 Tax=Hibiscus sabdariffa TaxID=183260 RepID=A0ABR2CIG9_9ROSI